MCVCGIACFSLSRSRCYRGLAGRRDGAVVDGGGGGGGGGVDRRLHRNGVVDG